MDLHDFYTGRTFDAHRFFGAHFEGDCVTFRTYAPGAQAVELIGEFNGWQGMPMAREGQGGIFSCRIQGRALAFGRVPFHRRSLDGGAQPRFRCARQYL